jgi:hypothetical protein
MGPWLAPLGCTAEAILLKKGKLAQGKGRGQRKIARVSPAHWIRHESGFCTSLQDFLLRVRGELLSGKMVMR